MKFYRIQAELLGSLLVQENRRSNASRGLRYLPGGSFRGAVAGKFLREGGTPEAAVFRDVFLDNPVCFPDLLPLTTPGRISQPLPATAYSCKRSPGFVREGGHGVSDVLAALLAVDIERRPLTKAFVCKTCQEDMKPFEGFWNGDTEFPETFEPVMAYRRHTGIDRHTGTVASSVFYITEGIAESLKDQELQYQPQYLSGGAYLRDSQFETLSEWLQEPIFAGADKTRGMGEMAVTLEECNAPDFDLEAWDNGFRKKTARLTGKEISSGLHFSVGLTGHAISVDLFLRPLPDVELDFPGITPITRVVQGHLVRGWQSSRQLPKSEDVAVRAGGVCLYRYTGDDAEGLGSYLRQTAAEGIGLRRSEGFGRIRICDPIHVQEVT
ncbi:MAG: hypothetical protein V1792_09170 [Pseudomonadota bacterium]